VKRSDCYFKEEAPLKLVFRMIVLLTAAAVAASSGWGGSAPPRPNPGQVCWASKPIDKAADYHRDDRLAVAALKDMGVPLQRDVLGRVRWIEAVQGEFSDEAMRQLPGLPVLEWLEIGRGKVTAAGMAHLKGCSALRRLYVHDVRLSDDTLSILTGLTHLEALSLQRTGITARGLKHLKAIATLRVLNLSSDEIVDEDLAQIARFTGLEVLALENTKVTGVGLAKLEGIAAGSPTAYMCAEKLFFKCHRRFISDALTRRGWQVIHIFDAKRAQPHELRAPGPELPFGGDPGT
jgi:hypothetical protein